MDPGQSLMVRSMVPMSEHRYYNSDSDLVGEPTSIRIRVALTLASLG
jgi:hypothetical protein